MKLLMISGDRSLLRKQRGAFWYTLEEFRKHWERIDIICPRTAVSHEVSDSSLTSHIFENVFFHPSFKGLWHQPWWILSKGGELVKEHAHEVMTVHEYPPFYNGIGARWLSKKLHVPYAIEIHHVVGFPVAASNQEWVGRLLSFLYLRFDVRRARALRCVNAATKHLLSQWGVPEEKVAVLPSFYLDREALLETPPLQEKVYDIVFCGRLVANKGVHEILQAIGSMPPYVTTLIIGDGPERGSLEEKAKKLNLSERVKFCGWLSENTDVYRAMQSGKVFVVASKSEGGPRVALEAMALGLPVVSTCVGVMPEVIQDGVNGMFTSGDPKDIAGKVLQLLHDADLRERMGSEARKILEKFERKALIAAYAEFLKGIAHHTSSVSSL